MTVLFEEKKIFRKLVGWVEFSSQRCIGTKFNVKDGESVTIFDPASKRKIMRALLPTSSLGHG